MRSARVLTLRLQKLSRADALQYLNVCNASELAALASYLNVHESKVGTRIQRCIEKLFPPSAPTSSKTAPSAVHQSRLFDEPLFEELEETNQ